MAWGQARGRRVGHGNKEPRGRGCGMKTRGINPLNAIINIHELPLT